MLHNERIQVTVQSSVGSKYGDYIPEYYETHNTEGWVKDAFGFTDKQVDALLKDGMSLDEIADILYGEMDLWR